MQKVSVVRDAVCRECRGGLLSPVPWGLGIHAHRQWVRFSAIPLLIVRVENLSCRLHPRRLMGLPYQTMEDMKRSRRRLGRIGRLQRRGPAIHDRDLFPGVTWPMTHATEASGTRTHICWLIAFPLLSDASSALFRFVKSCITSEYPRRRPKRFRRGLITIWIHRQEPS